MGIKGIVKNDSNQFGRKVKRWPKLKNEQAIEHIIDDEDTILQKVEIENMNRENPEFEKKLAELDEKLKTIEDPDIAWYIIETSFLRDWGPNGKYKDPNPDLEIEQKILEFEIAHGTKILAGI